MLLARTIATSLTLAAAVSTALFTAASTAMAQTGVHPGFTITNLRPAGFNPMVSGLDFLPDGRLVVSTWEGFSTTKGNVYLVSNAKSGDASKVTYTKFAGNLYEPLGVSVVDGKIYVLQKDPLSLLPDANNDGVAETPEKLVTGWGIATMPAGVKSLEFAMANGKVSFRVTSAGHFSLDIRDSQGRIVESRGGMGPVEMVSKRSTGMGSIC